MASAKRADPRQIVIIELLENFSLPQVGSRQTMYFEIDHLAVTLPGKFLSKEWLRHQPRGQDDRTLSIRGLLGHDLYELQYALAVRDALFRILSFAQQSLEAIEDD